MKKSLKTIVAISALSLTLGAALAVGGKAEVKAAKATGEDFTVFIGAYTGIMSSAAGVNYWGGSRSGKADAYKIGDNLWYANIPNDTTGFQILEINSGKTIANDGDAAIKGYSWDITFDSTKTFVALKWWKDGKMDYDYNANSGKKQLLSGERYYLNTRDVSSYWGTVEGEVTKFYTYANNFYGRTTTWETLTRIGQSNLYYWDVTHPTIIDGVVPVRAKSEATESFDDVYTQADDATDFSKNTIYVNGDNKVSYDQKDEVESIGYEFACYFLDATSAYNYCDKANNSMDTSELVATYNAGETAKAGSKAHFYTGVSVLRGKGYTLEDYGGKEGEALSRYVNMQEDRGYGDFLGLGDANPANKSNNAFVPVAGVIESGQANYTAIVILASTLALVAVGGYFLLRKARKED